MSSENAIVEVHLHFEDGSDLVRVTPLEGNLYRIEETNLIFIHDSITYHDVIEADRQADGSLLFQRVVEKSNWKVFYPIWGQLFWESEAFTTILKKVENQGGFWDIMMPGIIAIFIPPEVDFNLQQEAEALWTNFNLKSHDGKN